MFIGFFIIIKIIVIINIIVQIIIARFSLISDTGMTGSSSVLAHFHIIINF